jgi:hypothetical protein
MKTCNKCNKTKSTDNFSRNRRNRDGLQYSCKECNKKQNKKYKEEHPKYWSGWQKKNSAKWASYMTEWSKNNDYKVQKNFKHKHDHKPVVYLIPEYMYVGLTENLYKRMAYHKYSGKDTSNFIVLKEFDTRREAEEYEYSLHLLGYKGNKKLEN